MENNYKKQSKDSFRQNASFAEKNLSNESIFSPSNDDYDVKTMNRKKVEKLMIELEIIQSSEAPPIYKHVGRKGIAEWIWKNKVLKEIPSTSLKSYLNKKKKIDAMRFYRQYKLVLELSQQLAIFKEIPIESVNDADIFNEHSLRYLLENFALTNQKKQLIASIYKKQGWQITDQNYPTTPTSNTSDYKDKILHPKVTEFIKQMNKEGKAEGTIKKFISYINMFLPWLANNLKDFQSYKPYEIPTIKIRAEHLHEFRLYLLKKEKHKEYSTITVAECLYAIKQLFQFLHGKYGFPNPARKLKSIKAPRYKYRELPTPEQINIFLGVINQYSDNPVLERVGFRLMYSLGLRSIEVARLTWNDINLETKTIRIHGKGNRYDMLPLEGQLYEDFQMIKHPHPTYILGESINKNLKMLQDNYKLYSLIAGWEFKGGLHLFRHLFVTNLSSKNVLPQAIKSLARVEKLDTVSLYIHINQKSAWLNDQINKLDYKKEDN